MSELDDLINEISDISKPRYSRTSSAKVDVSALDHMISDNKRPSYASKKPAPRKVRNAANLKGAASGADLDSILNVVQAKVQSLDINEGNQGICSFCNRPILKEVVDVQALGKKYHREHFFCVMCKKLADPKKYYEKKGEIHCVNCFHKNVLPSCGRCNKPVTEQCITACNSKFHPQCFVCKVCGSGFPSGEYFEKDNQPYCKDDYMRQFANTCKMCNRAIQGECLQALGSNWHPQCFGCPTCRKPFGPNFYEHDGFAYCETHFLEVKGVRR
eukprot:TRINITY_DN366_c0_g1_i1.p1 TRINITY_DN366_c0_g1~~TRINITY_DN366_c0_g1_i1.p1  ORF type:complete len:272 (+),score=36.65 TRINITY_DN366_c0_g1_i1:107-922(+)